jgi:predicted DNA-binding protein with PD1-like motif
MIKKVKTGRCFVGRLVHGEGLLEQLVAFAQTNKIKLGVFQLIGAVQNAELGYYDQKKKKYTNTISLKKHLEITACLGSISLKDGNVAVHAHVTLSDHKASAFGGHLLPGTKVFAAELFVQELTGATLVRGFDETTGLPLWK